MHLIIGTGKVGLPLAQLFHAANITALSTSRSGNVPAPLNGGAFDWTDATTFENPFSRAETDPIECVFMTPPSTTEMLAAMKPFIDFAKRKGVKRFVLLSASLLRSPKDGPHAEVHEYISRLGVEWAVIRPSWFFQNFHPNPLYADLENDEVVSSTGYAKLGFVDAQDIAEAAFQAMTEEPAHNGSYIVFGPALLSYGDVAESLSSVTGRTISHRRLTREEFKEHMMKVMSEGHAEMMCSLEADVKSGGEEKLAKEGGRDLWRGKRTLREFLEEIKDDWAK